MSSSDPRLEQQRLDQITAPPGVASTVGWSEEDQQLRDAWLALGDELAAEVRATTPVGIDPAIGVDRAWLVDSVRQRRRQRSRLRVGVYALTTAMCVAVAMVAATYQWHRDAEEPAIAQGTESVDPPVETPESDPGTLQVAAVDVWEQQWSLVYAEALNAQKPLPTTVDEQIQDVGLLLTMFELRLDDGTL